MNTVKPVTSKIGNNNVLSIGGVGVDVLVQEYGTPLYVIDAATLTQNCQSYTATLRDCYPNHVVAYAGKAGMTKGILNLIAKEGMGLDVVSGGEIYTALKSDIDLEQVYFHGNNKSKDELSMAIKNGIRIVVDNMQEIQNLGTVCDEDGQVAKVLIRIKPEIEAHTHEYIKTGQIDSKFGVGKGDLLAAIRLCQDHQKIEFLGIHGHIGSQIFDSVPFYDLAKIMVQHMQRIQAELGVTVQELNLGGGIGIQYIEKDDPPEIAEVIKTMAALVQSECEKLGLPEPKLIVEPGRSIMATAGVTLYTVGAVKSIPGIKDYVFVDGGMADNPRPSMYKSEYTFEIATRAGEPAGKTYTIAGKFCESGDILGKDIMLAEAAPGDIMVVYGTGAYNYAMSSNYNRFCKPAMVVVEAGKSSLILRRETYDDLLRNDL